MQKIIYTILGLALFGGLIFGGLYINGNYNDKSQVSESFNNVEEKMLPKEGGVVEKKMSTETVAKKEVVLENKILKTGSFTKIDPAHYASGDVKISSDENYYYINMQDNFSSANGPDLFVYLSSKQEYKNIAVGGVDTSKTLNVGKLKSVSGAQSYRVSKAEFEKYNDSVIIWCKDFGVQFSRAELK